MLKTKKSTGKNWIISVSVCCLENIWKMSDVEKEDTDETSVVEGDAWSMTIPKFVPEDNPHGMLEESSFATLFPKVWKMYFN